MTAPAQARRPIAFWLVFYVFLVAMLGNTIPTPLYVLYQSRWHFGPGVLTLVFATYAVGVLGALLLAGQASDLVGRRVVLAVALGFSGVSTVAFLAASGTGWLFLGRLLSGLSAGLVTGTGTAMLTELAGAERVRRASVLSTVAATGGLGLGPVLGGVLAEYAPHPLRLAYWCYLGLLGLAGLALAAAPETRRRAGRYRMRFVGMTLPEVGRTAFLRACLAGFVSLALMGLFTALAPSFLGRFLHVHNRAEIGLLVALLFAASTGTQALVGRRAPAATTRFGTGLLVVSLGLVVLALHAESLVLFVVTAVVSGTAAGAAFVGSLATANAVAPADRRGQVLSTYFTCAYLGLIVPVIGVGYGAQGFGLLNAVTAFAVALGIACTAALLNREEVPTP